jgi:hypothetical protein
VVVAMARAGGAVTVSEKVAVLYPTLSAALTVKL